MYHNTEYINFICCKYVQHISTQHSYKVVGKVSDVVLVSVYPNSNKYSLTR